MRSQTIPLFALALGASFLVAACDFAFSLYKTGATQADFDRDSYECNHYTRASTVNFFNDFFPASEAQNYFEQCMMSHGWYRGPAR